VIAGHENTPIDVWVIKARKPDGTRAAEAKGTMLILHSRDEHKATFPTFPPALTRPAGAAGRLARRGYDVVLPDLRAHGRSGGEYITYGAKEKHDLKAVMDELVAKKIVHPDAYVFGRNYSGMVAVQYAAIDPRTKGVLAVAPYANFRGIARYWYRFTDAEQFEEIVAEAAGLADFDPADASAIAAARELTCPLVVVHGLLDASAPRAHSDAIHKAAPEPKRLIAPLAGEILASAIMEDWIADRMDELATEGVEGIPVLED
jgi:pimeloyl-ACP methyl ester carboxylesterase